MCFFECKVAWIASIIKWKQQLLLLQKRVFIYQLKLFLTSSKKKKKNITVNVATITVMLFLDNNVQNSNQQFP